MKRIYITVHDSVQGVFFRYNAKKEALKLDLKGYARNMSDRTVEIVAEGPEDKLKEFVEFCKKGPGAAQVDKVDVKFGEANNEFQNFGIRH